MFPRARKGFRLIFRGGKLPGCASAAEQKETKYIKCETQKRHEKVASFGIPGVNSVTP